MLELDDVIVLIELELWESGSVMYPPVLQNISELPLDDWLIVSPWLSRLLS